METANDVDNTYMYHMCIGLEINDAYAHRRFLSARLSMLYHSATGAGLTKLCSLS